MLTDEILEILTRATTLRKLSSMAYENTDANSTGFCRKCMTDWALWASDCSLRTKNQWVIEKYG